MKPNSVNIPLDTKTGAIIRTGISRGSYLLHPGQPGKAVSNHPTAGYAMSDKKRRLSPLTLFQ